NGSCTRTSSLSEGLSSKFWSWVSALRAQNFLSPLGWFVNYLLAVFVPVQHAPLSIRLNAHAYGGHRLVSGECIQNRLFARPYAPQEILHVIFARLAVQLELRRTEFLFKFRLRYPCRRNSDEVHLTLESAVGHHHDSSLVTADQARYVRLVRHRRAEHHRMT